MHSQNLATLFQPQSQPQAQPQAQPLLQEQQQPQQQQQQQEEIDLFSISDSEPESEDDDTDLDSPVSASMDHEAAASPDEPHIEDPWTETVTVKGKVSVQGIDRCSGRRGPIFKWRKMPVRGVPGAQGAGPGAAEEAGVWKWTFFKTKKSALAYAQEHPGDCMVDKLRYATEEMAACVAASCRKNKKEIYVRFPRNKNNTSACPTPFFKLSSHPTFTNM